ncbi:sigma-70 family RNA polymerase sigma factor [Marinobacter sp. NSM]|uniref:sigma-70 family RNA polymerase sigma factor n=1 Tax=Marinobacter sp. NSM TaxID=3458004 RepID=UPI0040370EED
MNEQADGLEILYRKHFSWLNSLLLRKAGCCELAADLAQDTFLRLIKRQQDPAVIEEPQAYLGRIARGLLANHWRRRDIEQAYLAALQSRPEAVAISPEEHHEILDALYRIDDCLKNLPEKPRNAFLLSRFEGLTYQQIAEQLGVSDRMVKKYMAKAMLHFMTAIQ